MKIKLRNGVSKICMLAYTFYETDNRVKRYAEALAQEGYRVDIIALRNQKQPFYEQQENIAIYRIQRRTINEKRSWNYLIKLITFLLLSSYFVILNSLKRPYKIIHIHNPPDFEIFAAMSAKLFGTKMILDIHDVVPEFYMSKFNSSTNSVVIRLLKFMEKISCMIADHVIISNHIWYKRITSRSVKEKKSSVLINYPDRSIFYPRIEASRRQKEYFTLLYPGTLNWHQGLDIAINAIALIHHEHPDIKFEIYGDGPEKENLRKLINRTGLDKMVTLNEMLPIERVAHIMASADIGIVPKRKSSFGNEAFSTKILEFMSLGVPVIVADTDIDKHYFDDSLVTFFNSEDSASLAESITKLKNNNELRKLQIDKAFEYVKENCWQTKKNKYFEIIHTLG